MRSLFDNHLNIRFVKENRGFTNDNELIECIKNFEQKNNIKLTTQYYEYISKYNDYSLTHNKNPIDYYIAYKVKSFNYDNELYIFTVIIHFFENDERTYCLQNASLNRDYVPTHFMRFAFTSENDDIFIALSGQYEGSIFIGGDAVEDKIENEEEPNENDFIMIEKDWNTFINSLYVERIENLGFNTTREELKELTYLHFFRMWNFDHTIIQAIKIQLKKDIEQLLKVELNKIEDYIHILICTVIFFNALNKKHNAFIKIEEKEDVIELIEKVGTICHLNKDEIENINNTIDF
jgi:hypothetical protein